LGRLRLVPPLVVGKESPKHEVRGTTLKKGNDDLYRLNGRGHEDD
jgi:hypothetical protein